LYGGGISQMNMLRYVLFSVFDNNYFALKFYAKVVAQRGISQMNMLRYVLFSVFDNNYFALKFYAKVVAQIASLW